MTRERLEQCERIAAEWLSRDMLRGTADALAAGAFVQELCEEVRRCWAQIAVLQPRCDVCETPLHGTAPTIAGQDAAHLAGAVEREGEGGV